MKFMEFIGDISAFSLRVIIELFRPPLEAAQMLRQVAEVGHRSVLLIVASGLALGAVMTLHTRGVLVSFGAASLSPTVEAFAFFLEIGPLMTGLLLAGRVGSGIGAVLANMRATEQIDGIESLSIDAFKFLVVPRVIACVIALPILTLFMDCAGLMGGYLSELASSHMSFGLYITLAFSHLEWSNFIPPTLKTSVFGLIIGVVSSFYGYTANEGARGVGKAATNSVVVSSLLIILSDVVLIKFILFLFPENAI